MFWGVGTSQKTLLLQSGTLCLPRPPRTHRSIGARIPPALTVGRSPRAPRHGGGAAQPHGDGQRQLRPPRAADASDSAAGAVRGARACAQKQVPPRARRVRTPRDPTTLRCACAHARAGADQREHVLHGDRAALRTAAGQQHTPRALRQQCAGVVRPVAPSARCPLSTQDRARHEAHSQEAIKARVRGFGLGSVCGLRASLRSLRAGPRRYCLDGGVERVAYRDEGAGGGLGARSEGVPPSNPFEHAWSTLPVTSARLRHRLPALWRRSCRLGPHRQPCSTKYQKHKAVAFVARGGETTESRHGCGSRAISDLSCFALNH